MLAYAVCLAMPWEQDNVVCSHCLRCPYAYGHPLCDMQHGPSGCMMSCRVDCCLYAVNMGYHSSVGNTTAAVTTDNTSAIAIACPTTSTVQWQTADLAVTTASSPGAGNVTTIYDVTNSGSNDTTYVAKVVLEPSYQVGSGKQKTKNNLSKLCIPCNAVADAALYWLCMCNVSPWLALGRTL